MKLFKGSKQKCTKCGEREPTGEDGLCDNCRYLILLDNVIESRTAAAAA
jgi:NMD protein affecting ribosome stability and mRNA decay